MTPNRWTGWASVAAALALATSLHGAGDVFIGLNGADDALLADGMIAFDEPDARTTVFLSFATVQSLGVPLVIEATGTIQVNEPLAFASSIDVTLSAHDDVVVARDVTGCNNLSIEADFDDDGLGSVALLSDVTIDGLLGVLGGVGCTIGIAVVESLENQVYDVPLTILGPVTLRTGTSVQLFSGATAGEGTASLTIEGSNTLALGADVGTSIEPLAALSVLGGMETDLMGGSVYATAQTYEGSVELFFGDKLFEGDTITFLGQIRAFAPPQTVETLTVNASTLVEFRDVIQDTVSSITIGGTGVTRLTNGATEIIAQQDITIANLLEIGEETDAVIRATSGQLLVGEVRTDSPTAQELFLSLEGATVIIEGSLGTTNAPPLELAICATDLVSIGDDVEVAGGLFISSGNVTEITSDAMTASILQCAGPVVIDGTVSINAFVDVQSTIDGLAGGPEDRLFITAPGGGTPHSFVADIGSSVPLLELAVTHPGPGEIVLGASVDADVQTYTGASMRLPESVILTGGTITCALQQLSTVDAAALDVILVGPGLADLSATPAIGPLEAITIQGKASASASFGAVPTTVDTVGTQLYLVPISIAEASQVDFTGSSLTFAGEIAGPAAATVGATSSTGGDVHFDGNVLPQLAVSTDGLTVFAANVAIGQGAPGTIVIDSDVEFVGDMSFNVPGGTVELARDVSVSPADVSSGVFVFGDLAIGGALSLQIFGDGASDQIQVDGAVAISDALAVEVVPPYVPGVGQAWDLVNATSRNGTFAAAFLPPLPSNRFMQIAYGAGAGGVAGTFVVRGSVSELSELVQFDVDPGVQTSLPPGAPTALVADDFDGDGLDDLAVTITGTPDPAVDPGSVLTFINQGTIGPAWNGFAAGTPAQITVGLEPSAVTSADLDGSGPGFADLATTNRLDDDVSVILNAAGAFGAPVDVATGDAPAGVGAGELTGDSFVDLIVTNEADDTFDILANDGAGTFTPTAVAAPTATGQAPGQVCPADIDNDKDVDVILLLAQEDAVQIFERETAIMIGTPQSFGAGTAPKGLAVGDLDGDFLPDLVVTNEGSNDVAVLLNLGSISFASAQSIDIGAEPGSIDLVDLEPDGDLDVVVVAGTEGVDRTVRALINVSTGPGEIQLVTTEVISAGNDARLVTAANLDDRAGEDVVVVTDETAAVVAGAGGATVVPLLNTEIIPGDASGDGEVGVADILAVLGGWGACDAPCPPTCTGDLTDDCVIDVSDLLLVLGEWGEAAVGGCCFGDGGCMPRTQAECELTPTGVWNGPGTMCTPNQCPQPRACCLGGATCLDVVQNVCVQMGGMPQPPGTTCGGVSCP